MRAVKGPSQFILYIPFSPVDVNRKPADARGLLRGASEARLGNEVRRALLWEGHILHAAAILHGIIRASMVY